MSFIDKTHHLLVQGCNNVIIKYSCVLVLISIVYHLFICKWDLAGDRPSQRWKGQEEPINSLFVSIHINFLSF